MFTQLVDKVSKSKNNAKTDEGSEDAVECNIDEILEKFSFFQIITPCKDHGGE